MSITGHHVFAEKRDPISLDLCEVCSYDACLGTGILSFVVTQGHVDALPRVLPNIHAPIINLSKANHSTYLEPDLSVVKKTFYSIHTVESLRMEDPT